MKIRYFTFLFPLFFVVSCMNNHEDEYVDTPMDTVNFEDPSSPAEEVADPGYSELDDYQGRESQEENLSNGGNENETSLSSEWWYYMLEDDSRESRVGTSGTCQACNGNGKVACYKCHGEGYKTCTSCSGRGVFSWNGETCHNCAGRGNRSCSSCRGTGSEECRSCR